MNQRLTRLIRVIFILLDLIALNLVILGTRVQYQASIAPEAELHYAYLIFYLNIAWMAASWINGIYSGENISGFQRFFKRTMRAYTYYIGFMIMYLYFLKEIEISRLYIITVLAGSVVAIVCIRMLHLGLFQFLLAKDYLIRRILIIGYNSAAKKLAKYFEGESIKTKIIGFCENEENMDELTNYPVIGGVKDVMRLSREYHATDIFSTILPEKNHDIYNYMKQADQDCIRFKFIPDFDALIRQPVHIDYLGSIPMFSVRKEPLDDVANRMRKRFYDLVISGAVIIFILSWLIPLLAIIIWLDSRGSVFFIQKRTGINNKPFNCIKFRSMKSNKEADKKQATKNDPRITRVGRFLRKTNIDELPQFLNVFMSDMSVVGPRPHMIKHTEDYSKLVRQYMVRQFLKPGITGWAQMHGLRGEIKTIDQIENRVELDLWYLENWSLWLDTKIILMTAYNMLRGEKNAY